MPRPMPPADHPGIAALRRVLTDAEFPTTKKRLLEKAGHWEVAFPGNKDYPVRRFVERMPRGKFEGPDDVVEELRRGWWFLGPEDEAARGIR